MRVALVYDRVNKWGGAERVLLTLHEMFPDAPLYTSVYNLKTAPWVEVFDVRTSFLAQFPFASSWHEYYPFLMPLAFESFSFNEYDLVISVTSEAAKGIITKPNTLHICYCLTPTRYLWSGYDEYFKNGWFRFISAPFVSYLRTWDKVAAQRPDTYIAISKEVQKRIKKYYGRESEVVYPPVTLASSDQRLASSSKKSITKRYTLNANNYFLVVSRLVAYKRIDIAIEACNKLTLPLVIIGIGSEEKKLKSIAGPTITFVGSLTDTQLVEYYKGCRALLFTGKDDFGLTALEVQHFGRPVIALRAGGAIETIIEGKTGEFFYPQNVQALIHAIRNFQGKTYLAKDCREQAEKFNKERFKDEFMKIILQLVQEQRHI